MDKQMEDETETGGFRRQWRKGQGNGNNCLRLIAVWRHSSWFKGLFDSLTSYSEG